MEGLLLRRAVLSAAAAVLVSCAACAGGGGSADVARPSPTTTTRVAPPTTQPGPPVVANTPEGLASQLVQVETAIRNAATPAAELPRLGHTQQRIYASLISQPEWQADVLARLPEGLRPVAEANVLAGSELRRLSSSEPRELPKWRIVSPPPAAELLAEYKAAEAASGIPWQFLAAIHHVETRMGRIRGDSSAGAQGPMQFLPSTWAIYGGGGDIESFHDSLIAATRLLRANGAPGDMARALFAYNNSNRYVRAVTAYADQMRASERAFLGYYHWQVYYFDTWLPEGWVGS
jgi:hypothetical protein